ncbi:MAG: UDP-N-acetylmuramate--L-alanine ligase [Rhodospirillaceae bacterium]|nr:UDP-N-acetylmuramate--L-alanine ligase [Rhodospirillaceae bacterium]
MSSIPLTVGTIHFVGIGGIGMSGIAEVLHSLGYTVQGSDQAESPNVKRLAGLGIKTFVGHRAENLGDAAVVVISSAVKPDNPEVSAARARLTPVIRRAEMLGELMRLKWAIAVGGTHGKTTTTSLVAHLLEVAGWDHTVIVGGISNVSGSNARLGKGDWMVVEADESDGSFLKLPATIAAVTNIDPEHLDHYGNFDKLREAFATFVGNIPFYGFGVLCIDHPEVQAMIPKVADRRLVTYGTSLQADVRAVNIRFGVEGARFDIEFKERGKKAKNRYIDVALPLLGEHNVLNSLVPACIAWELDIDEGVLRRALAGFQGVKRRFTKTGEANGITVIDDYGHHPVEIAAVLRAARQACKGNVIAVMQPHRYTRLRDLFEEFCTCFNAADKVVIADVYSAGEPPLPGIDRQHFVDGIRARGHRNVKALDKPEDLPGLIADIAETGDYVICLGAGSITNWAHALPQQLAALSGKRG